MTQASTLNRRDHAAVIARILLAVLGSYAFTWGFVALGAMLLFAAGMALVEAQNLVWMLGLLLYLTLFCWAFACRSLLRVGAVLVGGGAVMTLGGWLLSRALMP